MSELDNIETNDYVKEEPLIQEESLHEETNQEEGFSEEPAEELSTQEDESSSEESEEELEEGDVDIPKTKEEFSKRVGSAVSFVRKKKDAQIAQLQQEIAHLRGNYQGYQSYDGVIQDPLTGQYHAVDSMEGKILVREKQKEESHQRALFEKETQYWVKVEERFDEAMTQARAKIKNFDSYYNIVNDMATPIVGRVIKLSDIPASMIMHLAKNPHELERISRLSPEDILLEMGSLKAELKPKKKLSTKAPPVSKPSQPMRSLQNTGDNEIAQRKAQLREKYFGGFKT